MPKAPFTTVLLRCLAIVTDLAATDPMSGECDGDRHAACIHCGAITCLGFPHAADCLWWRAKAVACMESPPRD